MKRSEKKKQGAENRYADSCKKDFWRRVFELETAYLALRLKGCRDVLSVGCGPAVIEGNLAGQGFAVTGLDVSRETSGLGIGRVTGDERRRGVNRSDKDDCLVDFYERWFVICSRVRRCLSFG